MLAVCDCIIEATDLFHAAMGTMLSMVENSFVATSSGRGFSGVYMQGDGKGWG